jgi:hypothetical protein
VPGGFSAYESLLKHVDCASLCRIFFSIFSAVVSSASAAASICLSRNVFRNSHASLQHCCRLLVAAFSAVIAVGMSVVSGIISHWSAVPRMCKIVSMSLFVCRPLMSVFHNLMVLLAAANLSDQGARGFRRHFSSARSIALVTESSILFIARTSISVTLPSLERIEAKIDADLLYTALFAKRCF